MGNTECIELSQYRSSFEKLKAILYKDIFVNGTGIRVLGITYMDFGTDWNVKRHKHPFFETHYVIKDNVFTTVNGQEFEVNEGQFYLLPPGTFHSHRQNKGTSHIGFDLRWEIIKEVKRNADYSNASSEFDKVIAYLLEAPTIPFIDKDNVLLKDMTFLLEMAEKGSSIFELQIIFIQTIIHYCNFFKDISKDLKNEINYTFLENHIVNTAIKFIEENYSLEIDMKDIASSVHLSYSHLSRIFKKYSGQPISHHLNSIRLKKSQHLLSCSNKSHSQIASEVGFNSEFYFCKIFKKFYNISPGAYRKRKINLSD